MRVFGLSAAKSAGGSAKRRRRSSSKARVRAAAKSSRSAARSSIRARARAALALPHVLRGIVEGREREQREGFGPGDRSGGPGGGPSQRRRLLDHQRRLPVSRAGQELVAQPEERDRRAAPHPLGDPAADPTEDRRIVAGRDVAVEERLPGAAELVGELLRLAAREEAALAPLREVGAPSLDEVARQALAETCALRARGVRQTLEVRGEQPEEPVEGVVAAAVRGRGEQDEMPRCAAGQAPDQLVPLAPAPAGRGARMRLVGDHEVGARLEEAVPPLAGLYVVEADDRVRVHRMAGDQVPVRDARGSARAPRRGPSPSDRGRSTGRAGSGTTRR